MLCISIFVSTFIAMTENNAPPPNPHRRTHKISYYNRHNQITLNLTQFYKNT